MTDTLTSAIARDDAIARRVRAYNVHTSNPEPDAYWQSVGDAIAETITVTLGGFGWADRDFRWLAYNAAGTHYAYSDTADGARNDLVELLLSEGVTA